LYVFILLYRRNCWNPINFLFADKKFCLRYLQRSPSVQFNYYVISLDQASWSKHEAKKSKYLHLLHVHLFLCVVCVQRHECLRTRDLFIIEDIFINFISFLKYLRSLHFLLYSLNKYNIFVNETLIRRRDTRDSLRCVASNILFLFNDNSRNNNQRKIKEIKQWKDRNLRVNQWDILFELLYNYNCVKICFTLRSHKITFSPFLCLFVVFSGGKMGTTSMTSNGITGSLK
jgi:hypothetical protein